MSFASLCRLIPRNFLLFVAIVNGIVSLISIPVLLLLVYRHARDFCALILYPATLSNSLISSSSILVASLGFLCIVSYHLQTVTVYFFFCNLCSFSFFSLIALARTSKTTLNKSGKNGHPCLCSDLRGNAFSFENDVS